MKCSRGHTTPQVPDPINFDVQSSDRHTSYVIQDYLAIGRMGRVSTAEMGATTSLESALATAPLSQPNGPRPYKVTSTQPSGVREYPHGSRHVSNHKFGFANCTFARGIAGTNAAVILRMTLIRSLRLPSLCVLRSTQTLSRGGVLDSTTIMGAVQQTILYFKNFVAPERWIGLVLYETAPCRHMCCDILLHAALIDTSSLTSAPVDTKMHQPPPAGNTHSYDGDNRAVRELRSLGPKCHVFFPLHQNQNQGPGHASDCTITVSAPPNVIHIL
ncbi:hypothetical protein EV401DRAFT_1883920 [Pisolithus croceorrhizus]|nr:hypothetical protein EV401DRAFT_1883920 [Pisolithus croceorrhizus]